MDLSVLIVNWNTRDLLRACLQSLREARAGSPITAEILVVDNASSDGSAAMVGAEFPEVRLFANSENLNYAGGNNQGLAAAGGETVLLLNPDTEVPPGALETLLDDLRDHPEWGAVSPALIHPDGALQDSVRGFPTPAALFGELTGLGRWFPGSALGRYRPRRLSPDTPTLVDQPMASAFLVRKAALEQVGVFDPDFPLFFNDVDLCYRLKSAGWQIAYDPRVRVVHVGGASTRQVRPEAIRRSHEGLERFYAKHYRGRIPAPLYAVMVWLIRLQGACALLEQVAEVAMANPALQITALRGEIDLEAAARGEFRGNVHSATLRVSEAGLAALFASLPSSPRLLKIDGRGLQVQLEWNGLSAVADLVPEAIPTGRLRIRITGLRSGVIPLPAQAIAGTALSLLPKRRGIHAAGHNLEVELRELAAATNLGLPALERVGLGTGYVELTFGKC